MIFNDFNQIYMEQLQEQVEDLTRNIFVGPENDAYFRSVYGVSFETYDPDLSFLVQKYLDKDAVYCDVGANIGATVVPIAKYLNHGSVYAFEPSCAYEYLKKNIEINSLINVKAFNIALGEQQGEVSFKTRECLAHSHRITDSHYLTEMNVDKVSIETLDNVIKKENVSKLDFITIDVEGYESNVLEGCDYVIERFNPIFYIEFNSWCLIAFKNESPRTFLNYLYGKFTNLYWIRNCILFPLDTEIKLMNFLHSNLTQNGCIDNLICLNEDIDLRKKSKFIFSANELKTMIGKCKGNYLRSDKGKKGVLSYGPYIPLEKGIYKVSINLSENSEKSQSDLGHWDVYTPTCDKQITLGPIVNGHNSCSVLESSFEVTDQLDKSVFEVRTFSNGSASIELKSIIIERIKN